MEKLNKTARTLDVFFRIMEILAKIGFVAMIVFIVILGGALLLNVDPNVVGTGYSILEFGSVSFTLADSIAPDAKTVMIHGLIEMVISLASIVLTVKAIKCVRQILAPMTEGEPFRDSITANLKKLGWYAVILGVISNVIEVVNYVVTIFIYQIPELLMGLFAEGTVTHVEFVSGFDWTFLVVAGVLFLMSYIFSYGAELQKLSDETL